MNDIELIRSKIYEIRDQKVMLDFDLAAMYGVETKQLKRTVKRNLKRFEGEDFMFVLTPDEFLRCQNGTSSHGGTRYMPYAFTELGVAMLSSVLHSETAIEINRGIMRAFVTVRHMLSAPKTDKFAELSSRVDKLEQYIDEVITDINDVNEDTRMQIELINESLAELQADKKISRSRKRIGFDIDNKENK